MAMADTTPSKVYDIAEQLGYEGARTQSSAKAVNACADALGFVGPHSRRITDPLTDLKSVVGGGGGGGNVLVVNMESGSGSQSAKMIADKTAKEIYDAANAGTPVFALMKAGPSVMLFPLGTAMHMDNASGVIFAAASYTRSSDAVSLIALTLDGGAADGTVYTLTTKTLATSS